MFHFKMTPSQMSDDEMKLWEAALFPVSVLNV